MSVRIERSIALNASIFETAAPISTSSLAFARCLANSLSSTLARLIASLARVASASSSAL